MGGKRVAGGDETLPYTDRFNDLYTETKVVAERFVLSQNTSPNGRAGMLTCAIRPSGIWGRGDQTMFRKLFESVVAGHVKVLIGRKSAKLDNSYVHNLVHGFIMAAQHLVPGGTAPGQAYFINDGEPVNMFEFAQPIIKACGQRWPRLRVSGAVVRSLMVTWQRLHFRFGCLGRHWNPWPSNGFTWTTTSPSSRRSATWGTGRCSLPSRRCRSACRTTPNCSKRSKPPSNTTQHQP